MFIKNIFRLIKRYEVFFELLVMALIMLIVYIVNQSNYPVASSMIQNDIGSEYNQAKGIGMGINPYQKIANNSVLINDKYATLFPLYYYFLYIIYLISGSSFDQFIYNFRVVLFLFEGASLCGIYLIFRERKLKLLGLLVGAYFLLNRWTLLSVATLKQDMVAMAFLIFALYFLDKRFRLSFFLLGISLGIKHLGVFVLPYIFFKLLEQKIDIKKITKGFIITLIPIIVPSISFMINDFRSFFYSIMFSVTRKPASSCGITPTGYERLLVNYDNLGNSLAMFYLLLPRLPLAVFTLTSILLALFKKIRPEVYLCLIYIIFAGTNPVYFDQYMMWVVPFVGISLAALPK